MAYVGHRVMCVDKDASLVSELTEGRIRFYEPDLEKLVEKGTRRERLVFSTELTPVVRNADVVFYPFIESWRQAPYSSQVFGAVKASTLIPVIVDGADGFFPQTKPAPAGVIECVRVKKEKFSGYWPSAVF